MYSLQNQSLIGLRSLTGSRFLALLLVCLIFSGCGEAAPPMETWPVQGTVVDQNGKAVTSGVVRFMTDADPQLITVGPIEADGSFDVRTERNGFSYKGAVTGPYDLLVLTAKDGPNNAASPVQYRLPQPHTVKTEPNTFELKIRL